ncbi:non-ribosomal peptide synthase domain TIGR01720/amino acid adenylation domain-containing protein [Bacillus sp. 71mf]|uniref:amino acid adenylation domain-containing protein n=2 Tax=unclassified Bacillus (in: firmicutes) TaxID=185979 RepID=UPI0008E3B4AE|nr:non-ribosomal peptide synthase domain TIGR01720/amino acid adenylation domain-containing protein [Bacillus sp. 71mf]SFS37494.1 non-ribosomal peptide synthase domain TIGR01720/amino acid adenylation domain-containing protein [Bacillus sp. 103mf]
MKCTILEKYGSIMSGYILKKEVAFLVVELQYIPLTHPQKRILNIEYFYPDIPINHIGGIIQITGKLNLMYLEQAIQSCIQTTEALRVHLTSKDGEVLQYIKKNNHIKIPFYDFSNDECPKERMLQWAEREFQQPFLFLENPLVKFAVLKIDENTCGYLIKCHHIIADGWSMKIIIDKIEKLYMQLVEEKNPIEKSDNYYIWGEKEKKYMESSRFKKDEDFWKNEFSDLKGIYLQKSSEQINGNRKTFKIGAVQSKKIYQFIKEQGCSLNALFTAAVFCYLSKASAQNDLIIGTPVLNRSGNKEKETAGMTVSTMPFRKKINLNLPFSTFLLEINKTYLKYFQHQRYPYDVLVKELQLAKEGYEQLFQIYINSYSTNMVSDIDGNSVEYIELYNGYQPYSLQIVIKEWDKSGTIELQFDYKQLDYREDEIDLLNERLNILIENVLQNPEICMKDISLLNNHELEEEIYEWNQTKTDYPKEKVIYELFKEQVRLHSNKVAIEDQNKVLSYQELEEYSNKIARYFLEKGLKRNDFVAVCMNHSPEMIALLLGILKAGGAYVPIDPDYPVERMDFILEDSESTFLVTDSTVEQIKNCTFSGNIIRFELSIFTPYDAGYLHTINSPTDTAYMIYTSGSTGQPKGVIIAHQNLVNYITSSSNNYITSHEDSFALYSSISFDLTVTSIFTPLITGSKIVIYRQEDTTEFVIQRIFRENKTTVIKLTPAHLSLLKDCDISKSSVKRLIVGGEQLSTDLAKKIVEAGKNQITIFNEYGPTEATVGCMIHKYDVNTDLHKSVPIGLPIQNTEIYLLDELRQPVMPGEIGEVFISGDGIGKGYWKRLNLQEQNFMENPFVKGKRMYKTGDLGKRLENGKIEYLGRKDNQVKIRGYRIELDEIELTLLSLNEIEEAVVVAFDNEHKQKQLVAYIVQTEESTTFLLRKKLARLLPAFMIPSYFVPVDRLPLTQNGKINRGALPTLDLKHLGSHLELNNQQKALEGLLLEIAQEVLGRQNIKLEDHFYQIGGDSIKAIQYVSKLKEKGLYLKTNDIFTYPVFKELASVVGNQPVREIPQAQTEGEVMETPITKWFWCLGLNQPAFWHQSVMLSSENIIREAEVKEVVQILLNHHDALRIKVKTQNNRLYYDNAMQDIEIKSYDLSLLTEDQVDEEIKRLGPQLRETMDIYSDTLLKIGLIKTKNKTMVLFTAHHLIVDGVSWQVFIEDFLNIYNAIHKGETWRLPLKTHSYQVFAEKVNELAKSEELLSEQAYWLKEVKRIQPLYNQNKGEEKVKDSMKMQRKLDLSMTEKLLSTANRAYQTRIYELLLAALTRACHQCTSQNIVSLELEGHGRDQMEGNMDFSRTLGWFTTMFPANFSMEQSLSAHIRSVKETFRQIPRKGMGYGILAYLNNQFLPHQKPELRFNYLGEIDQMLTDKCGYSISYLNSGNESSPENQLTTHLDLTASIHNQQLTFNLAFSHHTYEIQQMEELMDELLYQLELITNHCCEKNYTEFTPSDFETASISLEEMDSLFR